MFEWLNNPVTAIDMILIQVIAYFILLAITKHKK